VYKKNLAVVEKPFEGDTGFQAALDKVCQARSIIEAVDAAIDVLLTTSPGLSNVHQQEPCSGRGQQGTRVDRFIRRSAVEEEQQGDCGRVHGGGSQRFRKAQACSV
jgi:hypothetical protein